MSKLNKLSPRQYVALFATGAAGLATAAAWITPSNAASTKSATTGTNADSSSGKATVFLVRTQDDPEVEALANEVLKNLINGQGPDSALQINPTLQTPPVFTPSDSRANDVERISDIDEFIQDAANGYSGTIIVLSDTQIDSNNPNDGFIQLAATAKPSLLGENNIGLNFVYAKLQGDALTISKRINTSLGRMNSPLQEPTVIVNDTVLSAGQ